MSLEEKVKRYQQQPNPMLFEQIWKEVRSMATKEAAKYAGQIDRELLELRAKVLLKDAIRTYNPAKGNFKTHYRSYLQKLYRFANDYQHPMRLPENYRLNYRRYEDAYRELKEKLGREPTAQEIAAAAKIPLRQVEAFRRRTVTATSESGDWETAYTSDLAELEAFQHISAKYGPTVATAVQNYVKYNQKPFGVDKKIFEQALKEYEAMIRR